MALQRLLLIFVLIMLAVMIYRFFEKEGFVVAGRKGSAPIIITPPSTVPTPIAAAGPAPPTQQGNETNRAPPATVEARDPYAETVDSASAPERITHPEHYYGPSANAEYGSILHIERPGIAPELTTIGVEAGVASMRAEPGPHNATLFTPDQVANGGVYYDDVVPLEPTHGISYSVL